MLLRSVEALLLARKLADLPTAVFAAAVRDLVKIMTSAACSRKNQVVAGTAAPRQRCPWCCWCCFPPPLAASTSHIIEAVQQRLLLYPAACFRRYLSSMTSRPRNRQAGNYYLSLFMLPLREELRLL